MHHAIFLSYRRADSSGHAGRLSADLERRFGAGCVFRDIASIDAGRDFVQALDRALADARAVLVVIGRSWLSERAGDGRRRLDDPDDFVRREVETALARHDLLVVPVLVAGAVMPGEAELPAPLRMLARLQAIELSEGRWGFDLERLAQVLAQAGVRPGGRPAATRLTRRAAIAAALAIAAAAAWFGWLAAPSSERFTGRWRLPNGSFWSVRADGDGLVVEETHYESRQVWKRGTARVAGDRLEVDLGLVFENRPIRFRYRLALSADGRTLSGTESEIRGEAERSQPVVLMRE